MKVLLIDDHTLFREGLKFLLASLDAGIEVDEAGSCDQALERAEASRYDLVLLDYHMPAVDGLEALGRLREAMPDAPVVIVSGEDSPSVVRSAIEHGAMGFIPKSATPEVLIQALRLVLASGVYLPVALLDGPAAPPASIPGLTPRQLEVLRCVIQGKPNKVIARELDLSEATIKVHLSSVLRALNVRNRTEAVYAAARAGMRLV